MKMISKQLVILSLATLVAAGCKGDSEAEKTKADAKAAAEKTADTAKDVMAETKSAVKAGVQQAGTLATNVTAKVKTATTNLFGELKEKVHNATK